jgi:hypothetical protein
VDCNAEKEIQDERENSVFRSVGLENENIYGTKPRSFMTYIGGKVCSSSFTVNFGPPKYISCQ